MRLFLATALERVKRFALPLARCTPAERGPEVGWAPDPARTLWRRENFFPVSVIEPRFPDRTSVKYFEDLFEIWAFLI
jgi:hypothetical protein